MRLRLLAVGGLATAFVLSWWLWPRESVAVTELAQPPSGRIESAKPRSGRIVLDVEVFRAQRAEQLRRAKQLAHERPAKPQARSFARCTLGHADLCAQLAGLLDDCHREQDAATCLAIGQMLADTPPRPMIAAGFILYACDLGDEIACARRDELTDNKPRRCEDDPFLCGWRARQIGDNASLEKACDVGVGDACAAMWNRLDDADPRGRNYLEKACQLGNPGTCQALGARLAPDCAQHRTDCYPPDPEQSIAALTIACEAGFDESCR